jgi:hypothetical protein
MTVDWLILLVHISGLSLGFFNGWVWRGAYDRRAGK